MKRTFTISIIRSANSQVREYTVIGAGDAVQAAAQALERAKYDDWSQINNTTNFSVIDTQEQPLHEE